MRLPFYLKRSFREALMAAYPNEGKFRVMLEEQCEKKLDHITTANGLSQKAADVIADAHSKGWTAKLVIGALSANHNNAELGKFFSELLGYLPPVPVKTNGPFYSPRLYVWPVIAFAAIVICIGLGAGLVYALYPTPRVANLTWTYRGEVLPETAEEDFEGTAPGPLTAWVDETELNSSCKGPYMIETKATAALRLQQVNYSYAGRRADARLIHKSADGLTMKAPTGVSFDFRDDPMLLSENDKLFLVVGLCSDEINSEPSVNDQKANDEIRLILAPEQE